MNTKLGNACVLLTALLLVASIAGPALAASGAGVERPATAESPVAQDRSDEFEPNDDFANATNVTSGTYGNLSVQPGDVDVYAVDLDAGETVSASIEFSHAEGDLELALVDPSVSELLAESASVDDGENVSHVATENGTYYVVVYGFANDSATYDMTLSASGDAVPAEGDAAVTADVFEPNDDFLNATNLTSGEYENLSVGAGDLDFYAVEVAPDEMVSASIAFANASGDLDMALVDLDRGEVVAESVSTADEETVSHFSSEGGTYYVVVYGFLNATAPYQMTVGTGNVTDGGHATGNVTPDGFEPNDDAANATNVTPGEYGNLSIGPGDVDVYAVGLNAGDRLAVDVRFSQARGDLDLALVDAARNETVALSASVTDGENASHVATENGTYYVVVFGFLNDTGPYDMSVSVSNDTDDASDDGDVTVDEFEPNDDFANATNVTSGTYGNLSVAPGDVDLFAVDLSEGETLSAALDFDPVAADLDLYLIGPNRNETLAWSDSLESVENVSHVATESGTYYLFITGFADAAGPYDLTVSAGGAASDGNATDAGDAAGDDGAAPDDPGEDILGWEDGYWANETVDIDQSDGLSDGELDAYVARAMARTEAIRELEFREPVDVTVQSREEFANDSASTVADRLVATAYFNQVFEATFMVNEETDAYEEFFGTQSATVGGYYADGRVVIVAENTSEPVVDEEALIHELTHALQDQHFDIDPSVVTVDEYRGAAGLIEGDANYVRYEYRDRCPDEWQCVETPQNVSQVAADDSVNVGISVVGYQPYSDGPALVSELVNRSDGSWEAVNDAYESYPNSTEQVIHPDRYPDEAPSPIDDPAGTSGEWQLFGVERVGEGWIYSMFFYQDFEYGTDTINESTFFDPDAGRYDEYNYTSVPSEGWGNDELRLYTNGSDYGYAWTLEWDTAADAEQFADAYVQVLAAQGAERRAGGTWAIPESEPFADAFHVNRNGTTVTVVNAPDADSLSEIAPEAVDNGDEADGENESAA